MFCLPLSDIASVSMKKDNSRNAPNVCLGMLQEIRMYINVIGRFKVQTLMRKVVKGRMFNVKFRLWWFLWMVNKQVL